MEITQAKNAICSPCGFQAAGRAAGIKKSGGLDLALLYSQVPALACGVFTKNTFAAHPVVVCRKHLKGKKAQCIIVNSGNANCFTGKEGGEVVRKTVSLTASLLKIKENLVLPASTGIIGRQLDFTKIKDSLDILAHSLGVKNGDDFARAIMTTDTRPKELKTNFLINGKVVAIGAAAKGSGMIAPDMATMLCFITTDARIEYNALKKALKEAVEESFNMISVDGCMSTNDSVIIMANGLAGNKAIRPQGRDFLKFSGRLKELCLELAKMIVRDGEGASKFIAISVSGARNNREAKRCALQIANSNLFKTAMYGQNSNMGRVVAAIGSAGLKLKDNIRVTHSPLTNKDIELKVNLMSGKGSAAVYTSDLTPEYIKINAGYN